MKTLFYNAKIYVESGHFEEALIEENGVITAVGASDELLMAAGDAEKIDCEGRTMLPGLNDSHQHLLEFGKTMIAPQLRDCRSADEIVDVCRAYIKDHPDCRAIVSRGWNEIYFEGDKRLPDRHDMDRISTEIPVLLSRVCGHFAVANTLLLEKAGFDGNTNIDGGKVELDSEGIPSGGVYENAIAALEQFIPAPTPEELAVCFEEAAKYAVAHGLTTVQSNDAETVAPPPDVFKALDIFYGSGKAPLRYVSQTGMTNLKDMKAFMEGPLHKKSLYGGMLKYGPIKMFKDGSLGARSALMRAPYADDPEAEGVERISDADQYEMIEYATRNDTQVVTHCIGDSAIDKTLDHYIKADRGMHNPCRHSVIHYQITDPGMVNKTAENNIYVAYQPVFLEYDIHICDDRVGKELGSTSYCFRTAYEKGIHASFGSDCPVEDCNPFRGIFCAVTRKDYSHKPEGGWNPQECVSVEQAIDMFTLESAYHEFAEDTKGRLKPGYAADLIVLDRDIFTCDPDEIIDILPVLTVVNGKIVYRR